MKDIDYFAHSLGEIRCDGCDVFLCYGYIDYADDCGFLCHICKRKKIIEQTPEVELQKLERLMRYYREMECGLSALGHNWVDVTHSTFVIGARVFSCTKCPAQKTKPYPNTFFDLKLNVLHQ